MNTKTNYKDFNKEVLTVDEVCQYTGLSKSTLYKLTHRREIPHFKPHGKLIFFNRREVEEWLQGGRVATAAQIAGEAHRVCTNNKGLAR